jgi:hypothetical protein
VERVVFNALGQECGSAALIYVFAPSAIVRFPEMRASRHAAGVRDPGYSSVIVGRLCQPRMISGLAEWSRGAASDIDGRVVRAKERERVSQTPA